MGRLKELIKRSSIYDEMFFVFYLKEKILMHYRPKSFGEYEEDLKVRELLGKVETFVDVGANDGYHSSNSFYWGVRGARGVCFEPIPETFNRLKRLYLFSQRVACRNIGISDQTCDSTMVSLGDQSYIPETQDESHKAIHRIRHERAKEKCRVKLMRFDEALQGLNLPTSIDLLTVDVEGHEFSVLKSVPFDVYTFRVIIVETHQINKEGQYIWKHRDFNEIGTLLETNGYLPFLQTPGNTVYTRILDISCAENHREDTASRKASTNHLSFSFRGQLVL